VLRPERSEGAANGLVRPWVLLLARHSPTMPEEALRGAVWGDAALRCSALLCANDARRNTRGGRLRRLCAAR
jgi:hypothetical protein